jgi:hypothetical protein
MLNVCTDMEAIYDAFNRQQIACDSLPRINSGCGTVPVNRPVITATPGDKQVTLQWTSVANANEYDVMRAEGGCDKGKKKINSANTARFIADTGLKNGFEVSVVNVQPAAELFCLKILCDLNKIYSLHTLHSIVTSSFPRSPQNATANCLQVSKLPPGQLRSLFLSQIPPLLHQRVIRRTHRHQTQQILRLQFRRIHLHQTLRTHRLVQAKIFAVTMLRKSSGLTSNGTWVMKIRFHGSCANSMLIPKHLTLSNPWKVFRHAQESV